MSQYLNGEAKLIYSEEDIKKLKEYFYSDLNNESALVNYLSALKKNWFFDIQANVLYTQLLSLIF